ncbi:UDP-Glycosyltransferase glycogen phosphorylase [Pyrrhoderma noxium]|uniref:UDP-Glycosyltransferase glycogen phosphorylase n=1 Tax=Pyrrhoderma noxium TaxID=2282107 RepID=A0A286UB49_9AGAM|nr:UDP-Glycosyltransferase glycogen phosphorylase [Pyrrhoderma noxium]
MSSSQGHIVAVSPSGWGHIKSLICFIGKMLHSKPVHVTIFVPLNYYEKTRKELDTSFVHGAEDELRQLARVVGLETEILPTNSKILNENLLGHYTNLLDGKPVQQTPESDVYYDGISPPSLLILDFFLVDTLSMIRSLGGKNIPVYILQSSVAVSLLFFSGPEHLGGNGNLKEKLMRIDAKDDITRNLEIEKAYRRCHGELLSLPGLPPMYDYEFHPQETSVPIALYAAPLFAKLPQLLNECDGIIQNANPTIDKHAIDALHNWLSNKPIFNIGPLDFPLFEKPRDQNPSTLEALNFLNSSLLKHGPQSIVYISFGTLFWFKKPELFWPIIDILIENNVPFMMSIASPFAVFPDETLERINSSGLAYCSKWMPQTEILRHEACGWFMTHCGQNSATESLSAGVPMICCPFDADQPMNAASLTSTHDVAYELFELRSGEGLRPIHRLGNRSPEGTVDSAQREFRDVLAKARGDDGARKRANIRALQSQLKEHWAPGSYNWRELERCLKVIS